MTLLRVLVVYRVSSTILFIRTIESFLGKSNAQTLLLTLTPNLLPVASTVFFVSVRPLLSKAGIFDITD